MGKSKQGFEQLRQNDINENLHEGVPMYNTAPKDDKVQKVSNVIKARLSYYMNKGSKSHTEENKDFAIIHELKALLNAIES